MGIIHGGLNFRGIPVDKHPRKVNQQMLSHSLRAVNQEDLRTVHKWRCYFPEVITSVEYFLVYVS